MKILFFIRSLEVGGSQRQLALLASGLSRRGHDVSIAVYYSTGAIESQLIGTSVQLLPLGKRGRWDVVAPFRRFRKLLISAAPDVIYAFLPAETSIAALVRPAHSRTRLVFGIRATTSDQQAYSLSRLAQRTEAWLSGLADLVICNGEAVRANAVSRGLPKDRTIVIFNGIDTEQLRPDLDAGQRQRRLWEISPDEFVIGMVARLDPMKDHSNFIKAAFIFAQQVPTARFICVGSGPPSYWDKLRESPDAQKLGRRLTWVGGPVAGRDAYNAFDIATLSSAFGEGFPNAVGEAMACGIPVVATEVGDCRLIVGTYGEVVPPGQPEALTDGWRRLRERIVKNHEEVRGQARATIVTNYGVDVMIDRSEQALLTVLANRS